MKIIKVLFGITALFTLFSPATVLFAATTPCTSDPFGDGPICYVPLTSIPGITNINGNNGQTAVNTSNPAEMVTGFYKFAIGIASVAAVVMIMWGGFEYMTTEAFTGKSNAKNRITYALVGLILLLSSYIILLAINKDLVTFKITLPQGSSFLSDATKTEVENQKNIENLAKLRAQSAQEYSARIQDVTQAQTELNNLKKKLESTTDPAIKKQLEGEISAAQVKVTNAERLAIETDIANSKKIAADGITAYVGAENYAMVAANVRLQNRTTEKELALLANDPVNGSATLNKKLSDVNSEIQKVNEDKTLSDAQKQEKIKTLTEEKDLVTKSIEENTKKVAYVKSEAEKNKFNSELVSYAASQTKKPEDSMFSSSNSPLQALLLKGTNQQGGVPAVDAKIDAYMNAAEQAAKGYEAQGKTDLAKSVRETAESGKQVMVKQMESTIVNNWDGNTCRNATKDSKYLSGVSVSCKP